MQIVKKPLLAIIGIVIYILAVNFMFILGRHFPNIDSSFIRIFIAVLIGIIVMLLKIMPVEQLKGIGNKSLKIYAYPIIFSCLYFITFVAVYAILFGTHYFQLNANLIFPTLMLLIAVSLFEEVVARAFFVNYLIRIFDSPKKFIAIISGIVFGFVHYFNYGVLNINSVSQCISATCIGIFLCAVFICENRIIPVIIIHTLINFSAAIVSLIYNTDIISQSYESIGFLPLIVSAFSLPFLPLGIKLLNEQSHKTR